MKLLGNNRGLSGNGLKILAMIAMTCDHVGMLLLPRVEVLRIIGRLAMPIYAYMIAEGCRYTHDRRKYLLRLLGLGGLCQAVYLVCMGSLYQCILMTFSLSVGLICVLDWGRQRGDGWGLAVQCLSFAGVFFLCEVLPWLLPGTDYQVDYGFFGALLPVLAYVGRPVLPWFTLGLGLVSLSCGGIQWWSLAAVPLLLLYNGDRGRKKLGWLFYLYYPVHLVVLYALSVLL